MQAVDPAYGPQITPLAHTSAYASSPAPTRHLPPLALSVGFVAVAIPGAFLARVPLSSPIFCRWGLSSDKGAAPASLGRTFHAAN